MPASRRYINGKMVSIRPIGEVIAEQRAREQFSDEHLADYLAVSQQLAEAIATSDEAAERISRHAVDAILALIPQHPER